MPSPSPPPPAKVAQLIGLLDDPEVKAWLSQHQQASKPKAETDEEAVAKNISTVESYVRSRITAMTQAVPRLPLEFKRAVGILANDVNSGHRGEVTAIVLAWLPSATARNGCSAGCSSPAIGRRSCRPSAICGC